VKRINLNKKQFCDSLTVYVVLNPLNGRAHFAQFSLELIEGCSQKGYKMEFLLKK
jgi:hypothetical protein